MGQRGAHGRRCAQPRAGAGSGKGGAGCSEGPEGRRPASSRAHGRRGCLVVWRSRTSRPWRGRTSHVAQRSRLGMKTYCIQTHSRGACNAAKPRGAEAHCDWAERLQGRSAAAEKTRRQRCAYGAAELWWLRQEPSESCLLSARQTQQHTLLHLWCAP